MAQYKILLICAKNTCFRSITDKLCKTMNSVCDVKMNIKLFLRNYNTSVNCQSFVTS